MNAVNGLVNGSANVLIAGGRLINPANDMDGIRDVYVAGGKVVAIGQKDGKLKSFSVEQRIEERL